MPAERATHRGLLARLAAGAVAVGEVGGALAALRLGAAAVMGRSLDDAPRHGGLLRVHRLLRLRCLQLGLRAAMQGASCRGRLAWQGPPC